MFLKETQNQNKSLSILSLSRCVYHRTWWYVSWPTVAPPVSEVKTSEPSLRLQSELDGLTDGLTDFVGDDGPGQRQRSRILTILLSQVLVWINTSTESSRLSATVGPTYRSLPCYFVSLGHRICNSPSGYWNASIEEKKSLLSREMHNRGKQFIKNTMKN